MRAIPRVDSDCRPEAISFALNPICLEFMERVWPMNEVRFGEEEQSDRCK